MTTTSATSATTTTSNTSSFGLLSGGEATLGRDEFLRLLVEQLKNQDPLKPQDNSQFVAELAQFSNLEQAMGINDRLDLLTVQSRGQSNAQVLSMVGQRATVKGSVVSTDGNGGTAALGFTLGGSSTTTTVNIANAEGKIIRSLNVGGKNAGYVKVSWDGRDSSGNPQPKGSYSVSVLAKNSQDAAVPVDMQTSGVITGISFDQGYPVLQLDNGASAPVSDLLRVDSPPTDP
jgi:flagellar basal-body rod modification protein FlgD